MGDRPLVVLHPDRPPGVGEAVIAAAQAGELELVDASSTEETAAGLARPGSILVSYRWDPSFLTDGLAWIQTLGIGIDQFPLDELHARGVPLCNARGVAAGCVAEHAFACLLSLTRRVPESLTDQHAHAWTPRTGFQLAGSTLGVLGLGAIGQQIASRAQAFGMTVLGMRRTPGPVPAVDEVLDPDRLDELCDRADVLIAALPGGSETRGLLGAEQLRLLGPGWLVNVGRGGTVDEAALTSALTSGELRGAALDVVDGEPLAASSPLWDVPGLLLTGHSASLSPGWGVEWMELFRANLAAARGERSWASHIG